MLPFNLALFFHAVFLLAVVYLPQLRHKPRHPEIYTVNLANFVEPAPKVEQSAPEVQEQAEVKQNNEPAPVKAKIVPKVKKIKKTVNKAPEPVAEPPKKAVSIKPARKKIKKKLPPKPKKLPKPKPKPKVQKPKIDKQKLIEAQKAKQAALEAARIARMEAEMERQLLQQSLADAKRVARQNQAILNKLKSTANSRPSGSNVDLTGIEKQFYNAVSNHVRSYWQIPEHKKQKKELTATVFLTISADGMIKSMYIKESSGDRIFDQYVQKALRMAEPLPRIPPAMKKSRFDAALVFKPAGLQ